MNEAVPWGKLAGRFGCDPQRHPVVGLYSAPEGCICYPDRIQALCGQHAIKGEQNNAMTPLVERDEFQRRKKPAAIRLSLNQRAVRSPHGRRLAAVAKSSSAARPGSLSGAGSRAEALP
jgi:hypothetical protein